MDINVFSNAINHASKMIKFPIRRHGSVSSVKLKKIHMYM